jgi:hypothetical protein
MFAQVISGTAKDKDAVTASFDAWDRDLKPGATGFLGSTGGLADDGTFFVAARFESADAARTNSDRPEQDQWWKETSKHLESDVVFHDCNDVETWLAGGSDDAGFVQVMRGKVSDKEKAKKLNAQMQDMPNMRPDVIGGVVMWHDDAEGEYTQVVYFTSEEEARAAEKAMNNSSESEEFGKEWEAIMVGDITFIDLTAPRLSSP